MKKLTLITIVCLNVPCFVYAQVEDLLESVESPVWFYKQFFWNYKSGWNRGTRHVGFYDGRRYTEYSHRNECVYPDISDSVLYIDLPGISLFWYKRSCSRDFPFMCQWQTGVLFPLIGIGTQWCIPIPCPLVGNMLVRVPGMSLPEDICP